MKSIEATTLRVHSASGALLMEINFFDQPLEPKLEFFEALREKGANPSRFGYLTARDFWYVIQRCFGNGVEYDVTRATYIR